MIPLHLRIADAVYVATAVDIGVDGLGGITFDISTTIDRGVDVQAAQQIAVDVTTTIDVVMCLAAFASKLYVAATVDVHADALAGEVVYLDIATAVDVERQ